MTNGPPGRDGPFEDRKPKLEQVGRTRSSTRSASPFADELTLLWGEFIAAKNRAYKTWNMRTASALGAHAHERAANSCAFFLWR
jgi:hypothetical protein